MNPDSIKPDTAANGEDKGISYGKGHWLHSNIATTSTSRKHSVNYVKPNLGLPTTDIFSYGPDDGADEDTLDSTCVGSHWHPTVY